MPAVQATLQRRQFGIAADQPRRAQHGGGQRAAWARRCRCRGCLLLFDRCQQGQCFVRRRAADFVFQHLLAAVEGQHRGAAVTEQVMQAHHTPVGVFGQRVGAQQRKRQRQRGGGVTVGFELIDALQLHLPRQHTQPAAALGQPRVERRRLGCRQVAEQAIGALQVVLDVGGQGQQRAAFDQLEPGLLAQPEQTLAQCVACGFGAAVGPHQSAEFFARAGAFQRQPGQQQRVGRQQRYAPAAGHQVRPAAQLQGRDV